LENAVCVCAGNTVTAPLLPDAVNVCRTDERISATWLLTLYALSGIHTKWNSGSLRRRNERELEMCACSLSRIKTGATSDVIPGALAVDIDVEIFRRRPEFLERCDWEVRVARAGGNRYRSQEQKFRAGSTKRARTTKSPAGLPKM
jgi:hypothetical protein